MNLFERIKNIFKSQIKQDIQEKNNLNNLVQYDTSKVFILRLKDLSEKEQQLVEKYMEEINLDNFETILNYAKELSQKANINTNILIEYLYNLEQDVSKIKLIKDDDELLKKKIELKILESKMNLVNKDLFKIKNEILLRLVSLSEIERKYSSIVYEFLGIFGEAKRIKHKTLKRSLNDAINRMKINIITMESQRISIDNTFNNLIDLINTLNINNYLSKVNNNKYLKLEVYIQKINKLTHIFKILFEEELIDKERLEELLTNFDNKKEQELINRLAVLDNILDKYIYENKEKFPLFLEEINNLEISKEKKEENLKRIERIELIFELYKNQISKEYIELLYEKKFYNLVIDIDLWPYNYTLIPFNQDREPDLFNKINKKEMELYSSNHIKNYYNLDREVNSLDKSPNEKEIEIYKSIIDKELKVFFQNKPLMIDESSKKFINAILKLIKKEFTVDNVLKNSSYLNLIITINYPNLYKSYHWRQVIDNIRVGIHFFSYEPSEFFSNEEKDLITFNDEQTLKTYLHTVSVLLFRRYGDNLNSLLKEDNLSFLILLLFGKYNLKKAYNIYEKELTICHGIKEIKQYAREENSVITYIPTPKKVKKIKFPQTFKSYTQLGYLSRNDLVEEINIPGSFKRIDKDTLDIFVDNNGTYGTFTSYLKSIKIDEGVEEIKKFAFSESKNLEEVYLPSSLKLISKSAFVSTSLERIYYHPKLLETFGEAYLYELFPLHCKKKQLIPLEKEKSKIKVK